MLDITDLRMAVRRTGDTYDVELLALAEAAMTDMEARGIARQETDALYDHAVRMYVKGNFDASAPEAEACRGIYDGLRRTMGLSSKYREADSHA